MSFFIKRAIYYLIDQFYYYLLIKYIKTPAVFKHQQFEDNKNNKIESNLSKCQQFDINDNKEK